MFPLFLAVLKFLHYYSKTIQVSEVTQMYVDIYGWVKDQTSNLLNGAESFIRFPHRYASPFTIA